MCLLTLTHLCLPISDALVDADSDALVLVD